MGHLMDRLCLQMVGLGQWVALGRMTLPRVELGLSVVLTTVRARHMKEYFDQPIPHFSHPPDCMPQHSPPMMTWWENHMLICLELLQPLDCILGVCHVLHASR